MARTRNQDAYEIARDTLLSAGERVFRTKSYGEAGINDVLAEAAVPKGSFYHYFDSKQAFGIAVAGHYHDGQMAFARSVLGDDSQPPLDRLKRFFEGARADMQRRKFGQGCLMCNLTTELADENPAFRTALAQHWRELAAALAQCLRQADRAAIGLAHLSPEDAADWLLNGWSGALTRMKATGDDAPLALFIRTIFKQEGSSQ